MAGPWEEYQGKSSPEAKPWEEFGATQEKAKGPGAIRKAGDLAVGVVGGAIGATKALTDVAGAGNAASNFLDSANKDIDSLLSPQAQADKQEQAAIMKEAEGKGTYEGVKAGLKAFAVAPVQTTMSGLGSVIPVAAATLATGGGAIPAMAAGAATGAAMGAGTVKGAIYDDIKERSLASGMTPEAAEAEATKAQSYGGGNTDQIALGAGLGMLDAATGVTPIVANMARKAVGREAVQALTTNTGHGILRRTATGALEEMPLEAAQGGQEQLATNIAAQRAGYQAGTWDNVASNATLEGLASAGPGAGFGALSGGAKPAPPAMPPTAEDAATQGDPLRLKHDPMAGTHTVFPDGSVVLNSESSNGAKTVRDMQRATRLENAADPFFGDPAPVKPSEAAGLVPTAENSLTNAGIFAMDTGLHQAATTAADPYSAPLSALGQELSRTNQRLRQESDALGLDTEGLMGDAARMTDGKPHEDYLSAANDQLRKAMKAAKEIPDEGQQGVQALDQAGPRPEGPITQASTPNAQAGAGQGGGNTERPAPDRVGKSGQPAAGGSTGNAPSAVAQNTTNINQESVDSHRGSKSNPTLGSAAQQDHSLIQQGAVRKVVSDLPGSSSRDQKNTPQSPGTGQPAPGTPATVPGTVQPGQVSISDSSSINGTAAKGKVNAATTQAATPSPSADAAAGLPAAGTPAAQAAGVRPSLGDIMKDVSNGTAVSRVSKEEADKLRIELGIPTNQGAVTNAASIENPGTQASQTPSAKGAAQAVGDTSAPTGKLAPASPEKQKALDRIASGKAWFGSGPKAQQFIAQNGLKDTHQAVKSSDGKRWDVLPAVPGVNAAIHDATPASFKSLLSAKSTSVIQDDGRGRTLYSVTVTPEFRNKHFVNGRMPSSTGLELVRKEDVTKNPYDKGWVLIDNRKQLADREKADSAKNTPISKDPAAITQPPGATREPQADQAQQAEAQRQEAPAAAGELGRFESDGVGRSEAEKELQAQSHKEEQPGDVLMDDGSFVAFDVVVAMAKEGIAAGAIRPAPAQMHFKLDMSMRDANRVLDAATKPADQAPGEALQSAMGAAGWAAEVAGAENTIWTKRTKKDRYTAILTPESNSMEITVLVDTVDTQIASFKVADPKDAAIAANKAVSEDVADSVPAAEKPVADRTETEHAGLKIYPVKVKMGDAVVEKWAVQTPDNAQREKNGERQIGGDPLSETLDGAKKNAEAAVRDAKNRAAREAESKAADDAAQAKKDANKGKSILQRRADALLDKQHTYPPQAGLGKGTRREAMQNAVDQGRAIVERMVPDTAAKHRDQTAIDLVKARGYILGLSNENIPVVKQGLEAQARMKANQYEKPEYRVYDSAKTDGGFYAITKTEFDYAKSLAEKAKDPHENYIKSAADSIARLRKSDVYRVLNSLAKDNIDGVTRTGLASYIKTNHPDYSQEVDDVLAELSQSTLATPVHQDPGEKPEAATAPVIAESLQKSAKKEDRPLAEMKAELLGMIDAAVKETPNYKDYIDSVEKFGKDAAEQMYARKDRPMGGDTVEGRERITFDVPGDGKFTVVNSYAGLMAFRAKIAKASGNGFSETKRPGLPASTSVKKGSTNQISAVESMLEDGDLQAAKDYMAAVGIGTDGLSKSALARMEQLEAMGDKAQEALYTRIDPEWQYSVDRGSRRATLTRTIGKDVYRAHVMGGTRNDAPDDFSRATYGISKNGEKDKPGSAGNFHDALVAVQTALDKLSDKPEIQDTPASKAKDTGWNMAGTGYAGKRYSGRNMTLEDGREVVARIYENAGVYEDAEVKVDGKRVFAVTDRNDAQGKADDFIKTLIGERDESVEAFKSWYNRSGHEIYPSKKSALTKWMKDGIEGLYDMPGHADPTPYLKDWLADEKGAPAELDLMGFTKTPTGNGTFTLSDSNMRVTVEPTGTGFQARMGSAASGPRLNEQQAIEWAAALRDESIRIQKAEAKAKPEVSKTGKLPVFPVDSYRLERFYANGAKIKPLPARKFNPEEVQSITDWFKSIGWSVTSGSGANGINATNDIGMTIDDLPEPYTAAQRKKDDERRASDERSAVNKNEQGYYLASTAAGKFVAGMFGDAMNSFNQTALAKVLSGDEKVFVGLFSNRSVDVLAEAGIATEGREIKDVIRDIKARFEAAPTDAAKEPWQMTEAEFGEVERQKALANVKYDLERAKNGSLKPFVSGDKSKPALVRRLTAEVAQIEAAKPEGYAGDHLAQINKALREGKPVPEVNLKRYDIASPTAEQKTPANTGNAGAVVSPDEFPLDEATRSYDGISQHSATRARSDRDQFVKAIQDEYDAAAKVAETPEQKAVLESEAQSLKADYLSRYKQMMGVRSGAYSGFFVGRANLNVKQADKRNDALTRANETFDNWLTANTGRIKSAVLNARNADQLAAVQEAKDAKAADKERRDLALMGKILAFKSGDDLRFGTAIVTRVSLDKDGYPNTITVKSSDGTPLTNDKINLASEIFGGRGIRGIQGGKQEIRRLADIVRLGAGNAASAEEGQNGAQAKTLVESEQDLWTRISDGAASVDEFKAGFENWVKNKAAILSELTAQKKDDLLARISPFLRNRYKSETKQDVAEALWRDSLGAYSLNSSVSYGMGSDSYENAVRRMVEATDSARLEQYADEVKTQREEMDQRRADKVKAIADPKTLDDYAALIIAKAKEAGVKTMREARMLLTPEQRATFDDLAAEKSRKDRNHTQEVKQSVRVAGQTVDATIIETKHTQKGHDLFVVKLAERVERGDYDTLNASAKKMGGYYSSFRGRGAVPGFQFTDRATAEAFVKLANGDSTDAQATADKRRDAFADDRSQSAAERLMEMADRLDAQADESLNADRKTNTARRARFASAAEAAARSEKAVAKTMRNIAKALSDGTAKYLDRIRTKTQIDALQGYVGTAQYEQLKSKYPTYAEQEKRKGQPPDMETADFAEFPQFTAFRSDLASLARQMIAADGTKLMGQRLLKVADDVSEAFVKFAKENTGKLMRFRTKDGGLAAFPSQASTQAVIDRSGFKGKAIPFMVKRGEWTIITSPSEAIAQGLWGGDGDKRITLTADFGSELVEKIGKANRRGSKVSVPWQFESAHDKRKMLARMGIETPAEFRSALREFIGLREQAAEADRVKMLERAMVGRRNDGLDFFPTPESVADEMISAADIHPDMAVLEPSAGFGHIADRIRAAGAEPDVIELSADRKELLEEKGFTVVGSDFMDMTPRGFTYGDVFKHDDGRLGILGSNGGLGSGRYRFIPMDGDAKTFTWEDRDALTGVEKRGSSSGYDRILMNPPFSDGRDMEHVQHAYTLLKPGGRLVALMGESAFTNQNKRATEFRAWLEQVGGTEEKLAEGSFMDPSLPVNTGANARMVVIEKPAGNDTDVVFSRGTPFYSELAHQIEAANINAAPGFGWKATLKGLMAKGVKADEITWSGIEEWLDLQTGKVTKAQVLDYLAANGVQVEEVILGQPDEADIEALLNDEAGEGMTREDAIEYLGNDEGGNPTRYDKYQLPGGENYREVLLTLPEKQNVRKRVLRKEGDGRRPWRIYIEGEEQHQNSFTTEEAAREDLAKYPTFSEKAGGQAYQSNHWDQKNVLAHIRVNDRTDADGKKVLMVEEIQSDFGQQAKKEGFAFGDKDKARLEEVEKQLALARTAGEKYEVAEFNSASGAPEYWVVKGSGRNRVHLHQFSVKQVADAKAYELNRDDSAPDTKALYAERDSLENRKAQKRGVPLAPFVDKTDKWLALSLKRIVKIAVDGGYDKVAFVNGEQSADRYDLSKHVGSINAVKNGDFYYVTATSAQDGGTLDELSNEAYRAEELPSVVGKELAEKIVKDGGGIYTGLDLKVGGEGMKAFYDQIVPSATKALLKKLGGGQMEQVSIGGDLVDVYDKSGKLVAEGIGRDEYEGAWEGARHEGRTSTKRMTQPGFTITPAMQEKASNGLPLFRRQLAKFSRGAQKQANNAVQSTVDKLTADWQNKPEIVIAFDMQDEAIPENVRLEDAKQRSGGAFGNPEGFYYRGVVYLLSSQLATDADIARVLAHESLGHYGLRGLYGKALKPILQQIATMRRADVIAVARQRGLVKVDGNNRPIVDVKTATNAQVWAAMTDSHKSQSAEEVLAEMAQTTPQAGFVKRAVAAIRQWLREHGVNLKLTDNDIIVNYILPARGWVENGGKNGGGMFGGVAFMRVWHGSPHRFLKFDSSKIGTGEGAQAYGHGLYLAESPDVAGSYQRMAGVELRDKAGNSVPMPPEAEWVAKDLAAAGGDYSKVRASLVEHGKMWPWPAEMGQRRLAEWEKAGAVPQTKGSLYKVDLPDEVIAKMLDYDRPLEDQAPAVKEALKRAGLYDGAARNVSGNVLDDITAYISKRDGRITTKLKKDRSAAADTLRQAGIPGIRYLDGGSRGAGTGTSNYVIFPGNEHLLTILDINGVPVSQEVRDDVVGSALNEQDKAAGGLPMFSRATTARDLTKKATEAVRVFTNTPGKVNWWHKTVGTQYNLAQRSPEFKRVYDAVQDFIGDVSFYATEAADLAPQILPKLDTWRDIAKSPLSADDTKAIAAPIFEGTLVWARDESGRPVKVKQLEDEAALMSSDRKAQRLLRNDKISEGVLKMWRGLPMEQYEALINGKYEKEMLKAGVVWSDAELRSQFHLTDGQIGLYKEFRAATDKSLTNLAISDMLYFGGKDVAPIKEAVLEAGTVVEASEMLRAYLMSLAHADPERSESLVASANKMIDKGDRAADLMARGYAPLSRFGTYTLDVVDADGERVYFGLFESRFEADRMARQMAVEYPGSTVEQGTLSEESYKLFAGVSPETVALFGDMLGLEDNGAYQDYLKLAKSTRSAMKRLIDRKGIAGFSEDAGRVLAGFVYSNARQTSQNLHTGEMVQAANDIPKGMGELKDKATQLVEYIKHPQEEAQKVRGLLFAQYIGGSVASAMVNMTQPFTMTMPWLSQFGGISKSAKQMTAAVKDATKKTTGDAALDAAIKRGEEDGTVSPQEVHDLMRQAQGKGALKSGDGTQLGNAAATAQNAVSRIGFAWGKLFSTAEQFNRRVTFIAAYRTAVEQGMSNPDAFARRAIHETQGVYNKGNKPDWARGAVGSTLFTFKQYSIAYVEMLHRMATTGEPGSPERAAGRRGALYALAVLMLLSGVGGLPGADDLDDIISGLMQSLGYNFDSKAKRKAFLAEYLGDGAAQFMERGVSGIAGVPIDISGRMGLGNLIPATGLLTKKTDHTSDVAELLGPAGDLAKRAFQAGGKLIEGDVLGSHGAVATASPKAIQNLFQAADMADKGMYRDQTGKKVMETGAGDALSKALGFQPNDVKRQQDATWEVKRMVDLNRITETEIADRWAIGLFEKDAAKVQSARDDLAKWNEDNPESPIRIKLPQIIQRVRAMNQTKTERIAKTAPKELKAQVREALSQQ